MAQKAPGTLRKITVREIGWKRDAVQEAVIKAKKEIQLCTVMGVVNGVKPGSTDKGDFAKLVGDFKAVNLETGEAFTSQACILPNFIGDGVAAAIMRPNAESVQFALTIGAKPDEKSVTGYVFTAQSLIPPSESSPLAMLEKTLAEQKLLPAPKK